MHWSEEIAEELIRRNPDKEEYVCAAGVSPSGSVHIGNFRDFATPLFVVKALQKLGKKAKLLVSWDEYDRCRKIPAILDATQSPIAALVAFVGAMVLAYFGKSLFFVAVSACVSVFVLELLIGFIVK